MNKECTIYKTAIDVNTGEEYIVGVEKETTYVKNVKADEFIMVYLNDLSAMMKLNEAQLKLTMLLWKGCSYAVENNEWNRIYAVEVNKQQWMKELNCSKPYIDKLLKALCDKNIITKACANVYDLNPNYFFKGPTKIREAALKTSIKYNISPSEDFKENC